MKTICPFLILIGALSSLAPSLPPGSAVVAGPAVVAIHGVAQPGPGTPTSVRTNIVGGITNVTTVTKYVATNFTMNAGSLLALLENSFNTNFAPGSRLLLKFEGGSVFNFIVSDSTGTNFGFDPGQVLSVSYLGDVPSGVLTETVTNNSGEFGKLVETDTTALSFTYDDTAMSTNTTDHKNTAISWTSAVRNKFSENVASGFLDANVTMDIVGSGSIRGGYGAVFTGTIQAKVTGFTE